MPTREGPVQAGRSTGRNPGRRQEILAATRTLFDEAGSRDAQIEDIARAVGINRAIIYRHFSSKEELFAETLVSYIGELRELLQQADDAGSDPVERLENLSDAMIGFGLAHPAFVDCCLALVRRPGTQLIEEVGEPTLVRLGAAMWSGLSIVVGALEDGVAAGTFVVEDPIVLANLYYTQALGTTSLAALQWTVRGSEHGGGPAVDDVRVEELKRLSRLSVLGQARGL